MNPVTVNTFLSLRSAKIDRIRQQGGIQMKPSRSKKNAEILESYSLELEIPQEFICSISQKIMDRPVYIHGEAKRYDEYTVLHKALDFPDLYPIDTNRLIHDVDLQNRINAFMKQVEEAQSMPDSEQKRRKID